MGTPLKHAPCNERAHRQRLKTPLFPPCTGKTGPCISERDPGVRGADSISVFRLRDAAGTSRGRRALLARHPAAWPELRRGVAPGGKIRQHLPAKKTLNDHSRSFPTQHAATLHLELPGETSLEREIPPRPRVVSYPRTQCPRTPARPVPPGESGKTEMDDVGIALACRPRWIYKCHS